MTGLALILFSSRGWLLPVLAVIVAIALALVWSGHRNAVERSVRLGCGLLKFVGVTLLALCLLEPLLISQRARPGANIFALVADNSQSLSIHDEGQTQSRGELLREQLTRETPTGWQAILGENFQIRRYSFDSHFQDVREFGALDFTGRASALGGALRTAADLWRGQPVAGVLLFTDGNATDLTSEAPALEGCPPIYPVVCGNDTGLRDIALAKTAVSQTAFEDAPVTIQAAVEARGFPGAEIVTRLIEIANSGAATNPALHVTAVTNVVAEQRQKSPEEESSLNFRFQIQPDKPGLHFYEVETQAANEQGAPQAPSREATLVNNHQVVVVDRGQEPFRVLYVGGRPNWEFKFLNRALQDDPQVHMVSLIRVARREPKFNFKSRYAESSNPLFGGFGDTNEETARYDQPVMVRFNTKDEMELRDGFPKTAAELYAYHAVILGDLEADFFTHDQILLLRRFVSERGGGFLMLGGAESFREGNYANTPIASMLPLYLDVPASAPTAAQWKLTLTREGWLQPWTRLRATESEERDRLDALPTFSVLNTIGALKPGASVLATVSDSDNHSFPALAAQRFGAGRAAALMLGDLWHWGFRDEASQKDLAKSWRQLVRWLVADVPARVSVTAENSPEGDPSRVRLVVKAHDEEYRPLDGASVQLTVRPVRLFQAGLAAENVDATNFLHLNAEASPNQAGTYEAEYVARDSGAYAVEAVVTQGNGEVVGRAAAGWASDPAAEEFRSLKPNRALLEALAKRTGGEVVSMERLKEFVSKLPQRRAPLTETWSEPLWQKPLVFLCVLGCFIAEWGIRRWKGLP